MPVKYIPYFPNTVEGQAILNNFTRTRRALTYRGSDQELKQKIVRGMPFYEVEKIESIGNNQKNLLIRGECISACAYLKEKGIKVDLVYIDPPFASGVDYAKKVFIRKNPKKAEALKKAVEEMEIEDLKQFEEKMYGDVWNKESYLNWMYENLQAIKSVMSINASIYVHLDWHIGHYVKILMDEVFGEDNFLNEIVWKYVKFQMRDMKRFANNTDRLLLYKNSEEYIFKPQTIKLGTPKKLLKKGWDKEKGVIANIKDEYGKTQKIEVFDEKVDDLWNISYIGAPSKERVDYPTQKPITLLQRILETSSNESMVVADFFGGSGVTAKVANNLKRSFIHVDIGINSIQTTRDVLKESNAEFQILDIKDGVNLFRNPIQTMDKLKEMILGLKNEDGLDKFWEGAIQDSKLGTVPVYLPNLLDHTTKVLDIPLMNRVINEAVPDLPDGVKKVIVYYIDIDDKKEVERFIKEQNVLIDIELRDLKGILDDVVVNDIAEFEVKDSEIVFNKFISDRLKQKIDEYNQKGTLQPLTTAEEDESEEVSERDEEDDSGEKKKKKFSPIEISENGLELIELISLDCTHFEGSVWQSDKEIKIDKLGYVIEDGKKTKKFWDGKISFTKKPFRMKVRNIAGDESIISISSEPKLKAKK